MMKVIVKSLPDFYGDNSTTLTNLSKVLERRYTNRVRKPILYE